MASIIGAVIDPRRASAVALLLNAACLAAVVPTSSGVAQWAIVLSTVLYAISAVRALIRVLAVSAANSDLFPARGDAQGSGADAFDAAARADGWVGRIAVVPGMRALAVLRGGKTDPVLRVTTAVVGAGPTAWQAAIETARVRARRATVGASGIEATIAGFTASALAIWCLDEGNGGVFTHHSYLAVAAIVGTAVAIPYGAWLRLRRGRRAATEAGIYVSAAQALADDSGVRALLDIKPQTPGGRLYVALTGGNGFHNDVRRRVIAALDSAKG